MDENIKAYIKNNAFYGFKIIVDQKMGYIKNPKIDDLQENLMVYIYLFNKYINLYEDNKQNFYHILFADQQYLREFVSMLYFFFNVEQIKLVDGKLFLNEVNYIDENNIGLFMETLRVLHHFDKRDDDYKPANRIAAEMMERARKLKREMEAKIKNKDGIGFLEISSTVCARHPSINPTNIGQLSYYQIVDQYKRLMMIDLYTPCLCGNATEDYIKKNNVKHYSSKIINSD